MANNNSLRMELTIKSSQNGIESTIARVVGEAKFHSAKGDSRQRASRAGPARDRMIEPRPQTPIDSFIDSFRSSSHMAKEKS
jgi:hypothetical protein